ncbi:MAG TPA: hypothetical protein VFK81_18205 [Terriglobales bacterium]|jgi:uncharacterized membrane protein HdeD (DUF308 family)|nr:hypothetical protein [Terriglobales bacterium]
MTREAKPLRKTQPVVQILCGLMLLILGLLNLHRNLLFSGAIAEVVLGAALLTTGAVLQGVRQVVRQVLREELNPPPKEKVLNLD